MVIFLLTVPRTNQAIRTQTNNQNRELLNQAQLQNLTIDERATTAREQNDAVTRSTTREARRSIAGKAMQQKATNAGMTLLNQMTPNYRFNNDNNQWEFAGGNAPVLMNNLSTYNPALMNSLYEDREYVQYERDKKGRLTSRIKNKIPALTKRIRFV